MEKLRVNVRPAVTVRVGEVRLVIVTVRVFVAPTGSTQHSEKSSAAAVTIVTANDSFHDLLDESIVGRSDCFMIVSKKFFFPPV